MKATITGNEEKWYYDDPRHPRKVIVTTYKTETGDTGSVEIPDRDYTPDAALKAVAAEVARVHSTVGMSTK
jgi:hypothetical protein